MLYLEQEIICEMEDFVIYKRKQIHALSVVADVSLFACAKIYLKFVKIK